jgi:HipA-like protein
MRSAEVHRHGKLAGHLIQLEEGYSFTYAPPHLQAEFAQPVSLTLPLREQPYVERVLFPFLMASSPRASCWKWLSATGSLTSVTAWVCY